VAKSQANDQFYYPSEVFIVLNRELWQIIR